MILFLTNNPISKSLIEWLYKNTNDKINILNEKLTLPYLLDHNPDIIISYNYRYIIKKDVINASRKKIINLHISLLPWNRGAHPNVWSFLEDTPKGVTIHLIDAGIDTGDILLQKEIKFDENIETLSSTYQHLHNEIQNLFISNWRRIRSFNINPYPQKPGGSIHYIKNFDRINNILDEKGWDVKITELKYKYKSLKKMINE